MLVCDTPYQLEHMGQLYRDRADCENGFDEIKNQWGWGGYSTHDIERCALSARAVGRLTNHGGQSKILLTVMPESVAQIKRLVANVRTGIQYLSRRHSWRNPKDGLPWCALSLTEYWPRSPNSG